MVDKLPAIHSIRLEKTIPRQELGDCKVIQRIVKAMNRP